MDFDVVIVGGGPAALTAGIYCVRRKLKTVIVERMGTGGQMLLTNEIGNWPGDKLISGVELASKMEEHAKSLGVDFIFDEVKSLSLSEKVKEVMLRDRTIKCSAVILAMGGQHKKLKVKGEEEFAGRGVSYCATCDGPFFKGKTVAVIGGGNMACEDALYLSELVEKTYLISPTLSAEELIQDKLKNSRVEYVKDSLAEISGADIVSSIKLSSGKSLDVGGVFIAVGSKPSTELATEAGVALDGRGFIKVTRDMETNLSGVFAAGDVTGGIPQIAKAVGDGCVAALRAYGHVKNAV